MLSAASATTAATRLTHDSSASESRPTEPVRKYAPAFMEIVTTAAAIESHAKRVRGTAGRLAITVKYAAAGAGHRLSARVRYGTPEEYGGCDLVSRHDGGMRAKACLLALM